MLYNIGMLIGLLLFLTYVFLYFVELLDLLTIELSLELEETLASKFRLMCLDDFKIQRAICRRRHV